MFLPQAILYAFIMKIPSTTTILNWLSWISILLRRVLKAFRIIDMLLSSIHYVKKNAEPTFKTGSHELSSRKMKPASFFIFRLSAIYCHTILLHSEIVLWIFIWYFRRHYFKWSVAYLISGTQIVVKSQKKSITELNHNLKLLHDHITSSRSKICSTYCWWNRVENRAVTICNDAIMMCRYRVKNESYFPKELSDVL